MVRWRERHRRRSQAQALSPRPKKARDLLVRAGYANGSDVQLYYSAGRYPKDREVCQAIAAQMVKGGFRVELISREWALFWGNEGVNGGQVAFLLQQPRFAVGRRHVL
jgi:ABC-type transport system substrate-binding protein